MHLFNILSWHLSRYPLLKAEDIYKLIYQGVFGPGHILADLNQEKKNFSRELLLAQDSKPSGEWEPIDPNELLIRVNLAPLTRLGTKAEQLFQAVIDTARTFTPRPQHLPLRLNAALKWCQVNLPGEVEKLKFIAAHPQHPPRHSPTYLENYRPAYRVVLYRLWFGF
ncbi:MAG: hypothetical protein ACUVUD_02765 [bacterium]